ncbi:methylmalonyl-CoA mutase C-terminal domain-containing protein [Malonomonas rubra DSM 5091]|uniref:Methylmalonyl-CoA mutase C-terminal domain-containing protein n=1 Tax=Malonomonas rubra DSM 5091 TaxID=1122189 RepID=A0A1M6MZS4_MALRU|nr:cobalamin-dependent protein [Malonomonas rubra]SHJ88914.1 methylmalonyl-CoA mutase C-terminal domain-containing protein [Malonomonas rubra DSM 5091]
MLNPDQKQLLEIVFSANRQNALDFVDQWAATRSYSQALTELLEPVIREFGIEWSKGEEISLAQGYVAGKIAEDIATKAFAEFDPVKNASEKRTVIIGNIEDDYHQLGRRLLGNFLAMHGWNVVDMGNDVLAEEFVDEAVKQNARIIGASAMMYSHALNIKKVRDEIDRRGLGGKIQLAVGGAVFNENLLPIEKVGADGTALNAIEALDLFEQLWQRSLAEENI